LRKLKIKKSPGQKPKLPKGQYGFVIGNGTSRKDMDIKMLSEYGIIFACNWFFKKEFRPHVLIASDEPITKTILKVHETYSRRNWFYTWFPKPGTGAKKIPTPEKFAAGPSATFIAAHTYESPKIFLIGMDFFGFESPKDIDQPENNGVMNNLYEGEKHYAKPPEDKEKVNGAPTFRNWQRRYQWIIRNFPQIEFYHVNPFEGKSPPRLVGFDNFHQITYENLVEHIENDAELIDIKEVTPDDKANAYGPNPDDEKSVIERQLAGQENIIYEDVLTPQQVWDIRKGALAEQMKMGPAESKDAMLQLEIGPHVVMVPWLGYIENGHAKLPTEKMLRIAFKEEYKDRPIPKKFLQQQAPPNLVPPPPPKKKKLGGLPPPPSV
jgi:hypothetical protein